MIEHKRRWWKLRFHWLTGINVHTCSSLSTNAWKCENERHSYEKCEYELVMERMLQMQMIRKNQNANSKQPVTQGAAIPLIPKPANAWSLSRCFNFWQESLHTWGCSFMFFYFSDSKLPWNVCPETYIISIKKIHIKELELKV